MPGTIARRLLDPKIPGLRSYKKADGTTSWSFEGRINGKNTRRTFQDARNRSEAVAALELLRAEIRQRTVPTADARLTVAQLAADYLENGVGDLTASTRAAYTNHLNRHVVPQLGHRRAGELRTSDVRKLMMGLAAGPLAPASQAAILAALSSTLQYGAEVRGLRGNVARAIGRKYTPTSERRQDPRYLSSGEVGTLLALLSDESRPVAAVCFYAAARVGEALALRWRDVDWKSGKIALPGTKTKASKARVDLLEPLAAELRAHRERSAALGFDRVSDDELVFQTAAGLPVSQNNVYRAIAAAGERAGLNRDGVQPIGCHTLRHSFAAYAISSGLTVTQVARAMRHKRPTVTLNSYGGLFDAAETDATEKLAAGLAGS